MRIEINVEPTFCDGASTVKHRHFPIAGDVKYRPERYRPWRGYKAVSRLYDVATGRDTVTELTTTFSQVQGQYAVTLAVNPCTRLLLSLLSEDVLETIPGGMLSITISGDMLFLFSFPSTYPTRTNHPMPTLATIASTNSVTDIFSFIFLSFQFIKCAANSPLGYIADTFLVVISPISFTKDNDLEHSMPHIFED